MGKKTNKKLANWLHVYKCKTSKMSEVVGENRTTLNLPLQFVLFNNSNKIIWLSGICVASLLLAQICQKCLNHRQNWSFVGGLKEEEAAVSASNSRENK